MAHKQYIIEMQLARGIGIMLVTLGHSEPIKEAYPLLFKLIYSFHMPLFFFMAGFFAGPPHNAVPHLLPARKTVRRLAELIVPYLTISCIFALIKFFLPGLVKRPVAAHELVRNIVFFPAENPALFLWFLYVIIIMKALTPLLLRIPALIVIPALLVFQCYPADIAVLGLGLVLNYGIYYYAGLLMSRCRDQFISFLKQRWLACVLGAVFTGGFALGIDTEIPALKFLTALSGLTLVLAVCSTCRSVLPERILERFGGSSLQLYLLQYFFIFPCYFLLKKLGLPAAYIVPCTFAAGMAGPWLLIRYIFPASQLLSLLFAGQPGPAWPAPKDS
jgi:fucose 4-O-acetylase-like acetyltransferase